MGFGSKRRAGKGVAVSTAAFGSQLIVWLGPRRYAFPPGRDVTIGLDSGADIRLDGVGPSANPTLVVLHYNGGQWIAVDRSEAGIYVDGVRMSTVFIHDGRAITLGDPQRGPRLVFQLAAPLPPPPPAAPPRRRCGPQLLRRRGPFSTTGRRFHPRHRFLNTRGRRRALRPGQRLRHRPPRRSCLRRRQRLQYHLRRSCLRRHQRLRRSFSRRRSNLSRNPRRPSFRLSRDGSRSPRGSPAQYRSCCRAAPSPNPGRMRPHRPHSCRSQPKRQPHCHHRNPRRPSFRLSRDERRSPRGSPAQCRSCCHAAPSPNPGRMRPHRPHSCRSQPKRKPHCDQRNG